MLVQTTFHVCRFHVIWILRLSKNWKNTELITPTISPSGEEPQMPVVKHAIMGSTRCYPNCPFLAVKSLFKILLWYVLFVLILPVFHIFRVPPIAIYEG